jgi:hypothetical protein
MSYFILFYAELALSEQDLGSLSTGSLVTKQEDSYTSLTPERDLASLDQLRKTRQATEVSTEQIIVEKLEQSRLEDEKKRADRLFGNTSKPTHIENRVQNTVPTQIQTAPVQSTLNYQGVVVVSNPQENLSATNEKPKMQDATQNHHQEGTQNHHEVQNPPEAIVSAHVIHENFFEDYYFSTAVGIQDYTSGQNIEGKGSIGAGLGLFVSRDFSLEGNFLYSNFYIHDLKLPPGQPYLREFDQWNFMFSAKYLINISQIFKPFIGGATSTTYRKYYNRTNFDPATDQGGSGSATSWSFDLIFQTGFDISITDNYDLGFEYRYSTNMFNRTSSDIISRQNWPVGVPLVEDTDYSAVLITSKYRF